MLMRDNEQYNVKGFYLAFDYIGSSILLHSFCKSPSKMISAVLFMPSIGTLRNFLCLHAFSIFLMLLFVLINCPVYAVQSDLTHIMYYIGTIGL